MLDIYVLGCLKNDRVGMWRTLDETNKKLEHSIAFMIEINTHCYSYLRNNNCTNIIGTANQRDLVVVEELKDIHDSEDLRRDDHDISKGR
jgi:hypothetical protein